MLGYRGTMLKRIPIMALVVTTVIQFQRGQEGEQGGGRFWENWQNQLTYWPIAIGVAVGACCIGCCCGISSSRTCCNRRDDEEYKVENAVAPGQNA